MTRRIIPIVLLLVFGIASIASADALDNWHWRNPLPDGNDLKGLAYGNGLFVAVGSYGTIVTSTDKITWIKRSTDSIYNLFDVAFGDGKFVAVGDSTILSSVDGKSWVRQLNNWATGITYGNGLFVAVAGDNIFTSPDGVTWTKRIPPASNIGLNKVGYAKGIFVAFGHGSGGDIIATSSDGITWTQRYSGIPGSAGGPAGFAYGNDIFVISGSGGVGITTTYTSHDGVEWTKHIFTPPATSYTGVGLCFSNGVFMFVNSYGIETSLDGADWAKKSSNIALAQNLA